MFTADIEEDNNLDKSTTTQPSLVRLILKRLEEAGRLVEAKDDKDNIVIWGHKIARDKLEDPIVLW